MSRVRALMATEFRTALRNYWFAVNSGVFVAGGVLMILIGQPDVEVLGYRTYARALAGLAQLGLFVVPLMALFPAATALAGERESGNLEYLRAQPVTPGELFAGKWAGVAAAVLLSVAAGLGTVGVIGAAEGVPAGPVVALLGLSLLLGLAFVSVGSAVSAGARSQGRATSVGLTAWLFLLALGSLGLMASLVAWGAPPAVLEAWAFLNPVEAFRMAMVAVLDPEMGVLGPVGADLLARLGRPLLVGTSVASLVAWAAGGFLVGRRRFAELEP